MGPELSLRLFLLILFRRIAACVGRPNFNSLSSSVLLRYELIVLIGTYCESFICGFIAPSSRCANVSLGRNKMLRHLERVLGKLMPSGRVRHSKGDCNLFTWNCFSRAEFWDRRYCAHATVMWIYSVILKKGRHCVMMFKMSKPHCRQMIICL